MKRNASILLVFLAAGAGLMIWTRRETAPVGGVPGSSMPTAVPAAVPLRAPVVPTATVADPSAYAELHSSRTTVRDDLRIVEGLLNNYLESLKGPGSPPLGFNDEIVRALGGANPMGMAFLPSNHPSIDTRGMLCDRWGTPYFFHPLSATRIEVRSAGPDKKLFTPDDAVLGGAAAEKT